MNVVQPKRYQITLWMGEDRRDSAAALHMSFDTLEQAEREFEAHRLTGNFKVGILMEWHRRSGIWNLLSKYP
jgi:hypothetical protein